MILVVDDIDDDILNHNGRFVRSADASNRIVLTLIDRIGQANNGANSSAIPDNDNNGATNKN